MILRHHDWRERFAQEIERARTRAFAWGEFDCALHVCDCIRAITGTDPAEKYRGLYHDEQGAAAIYGEQLQSFAAEIAQKYGFLEVSPTMARRGDVVFIDNKTPQGALAIVSLDGRFASCAADEGLVLVRLHRWKRAWQV